MAERVRVHEIDDDEGRRLLRIVRRPGTEAPPTGDLHPPGIRIAFVLGNFSPT